MAMIPHEKALVQRLKDEPFVLFGVNSDKTDTYKVKRAEMGVTWPSVNNKSVSPSISQSWGVGAWPTIYVLDHTGTIRHKGIRGEAMDEAVDSLLAELKASAGK